MLYLIQEYGTDRMNELFDTFKEGSSVDDALMKVYGVNRDELDNEWRASVGLGPRESEEDRSTTIEDEVIGGPEVADGDQSEQSPSEDATQEAESDQDQDQEESQDQGTSQAAETMDEDTDEAEEQVSARSEDEIAERTAEIQRRQDERRAGPAFEVSGPFPWEYPLIGVAGALILVSALLLVRVLAPRRD